MRVGILGSGLMGGKIGTLLARAGHDVVFSYARSRKKLERLAQEAGKNARAGTPADATLNADALLFAVHWLRIDDVFAQAGDLRGKIIITCSLPMNADNTELVIGRTSSGAEELAKKIPQARVVSAFNTVPSEVLFEVHKADHKRMRPSLIYCGDDARSKKIAAELIRDVGFDPIDSGPLSIARYTEPFALLVARLAYEGEGGPQLAYRFERFGK
jgi:8-hydroxy-5-deazaflavin:NADPH oxidoreductase